MESRGNHEAVRVKEYGGTWSISVGDNICTPNWGIGTPAIYNSVGLLPMEKNKVSKWLWTLGLLTCKTLLSFLNILDSSMLDITVG